MIQVELDMFVAQVLLCPNKTFCHEWYQNIIKWIFLEVEIPGQRYEEVQPTSHARGNIVTIPQRSAVNAQLRASQRMEALPSFKRYLNIFNFFKFYSELVLHISRKMNVWHDFYIVKRKIKVTNMPVKQI